MSRKKLSDNEDRFIKGDQLPIAPELAPNPAVKTEDALSQILQPRIPEPKEATIRFTADLPVALHRRLTLAAAKAGKKKVDLVREVLDHLLPDEQ